MAEHGSFVWNELMTTDVDAAEAFYGALLGWRYERMDLNNPARAAAPGAPAYSIIRHGEAMIGGMMSLEDADQAGQPSRWMSYISVDDVDRTVEKVKELGGTVCAPPFEIPSVGTMAVIADPTGAALCIMTECQQASAAR